MSSIIMNKIAENRTNEKKIQTSLQLTISQYAALKLIAYQQGRSMSEIAREVISKYIEEAQDATLNHIDAGEQHAEMGRPERAEG